MVREGKSGVHVSRLVQNIADQYPFEPQIAALLELVANSLDARASRIDVVLDLANGIFAVDDDGTGMNKRQFQDYHDFASSTKQRGTGIGFAGQGAKLALNFCSQVATETWSANYRGYSLWQLKGDEAPWQISDGQLQQLDHLGTRVTLYLNQASKGFYSESLIEGTIQEHFYPLLVDSGILRAAYEVLYKGGITLQVNGRMITAPALESNLDRTKVVPVTLQRKPKAVAMFGLWKGDAAAPFPGVAVCAYGKVIERTNFRKEPRDAERIVGWIEAPYLVEAITTDKCRFQKGNKVWEGFFRKVQGDFTAWLEEVGLGGQATRRVADFHGLERELNQILRGIPELSFFAARTPSEVAIPDENGTGRMLAEGIQLVRGTRSGSGGGQGVPVPGTDLPGQALTTKEGEGPPGTVGKRTVRGGIQLTEDERPELGEAWFDGTTLTINRAHPAYRRAERERQLNYHVVKCVCTELVRFTMEREESPSYPKAFELAGRFFDAWGQA